MLVTNSNMLYTRDMQILKFLKSKRLILNEKLLAMQVKEEHGQLLLPLYLI